MLTELKLLLGINDASKDELLSLILQQCIGDFEASTHINYDEQNLSHTSTVVQMAVFRYNQIGAEGSVREYYSGIQFWYAQAYPDVILRQLRALRHIRTVG